MVTELQITLLRDALQKILAKASHGNMAFVRCLESQITKELCGSSLFIIPEWSVFGVTEQCTKDKRFITADQAVELRENKKDAVLLLVDIEHAAAGMDGIYSATREIGEAELFETANELARKKIPRGFQTFTKNAVKKARRVGRQNTISPWREFEFLTRCSNKEEICPALAILGLWPIKIENRPVDADLDKSVSMVERLFLQIRSNTTIESRIDALMLIDHTEEQLKDLAKVLRSAANMSFFDAIAQVCKYPHLWLNNLRPGIFELDIIQKIEIISWWGQRHNLLTWSGLTILEDRLHFILNSHSAGSKRQRKLEVRWKPLPEDLKKGAVEYSVAVVSGDEELAEKKVTHTGKNPQKCIFVYDDFELEEGAKFEAVIQIKVVGSENISAETEDFVLCFGEGPSSISSGAGGEVRALSEGAIMLDNQENFSDACRKYNDPLHYGRDTKGFITFRYQNKRAKVFCPKLLRDIEVDWGNRKGQIGRWKIQVRNDGTQVGSHNFIPFPLSCSGNVWDRLLNASNAVSNVALNGQGIMGFIHGHGLNKNIEEYINAWLAVLENGEPILALANTVEVISLSGTTVGLIVLPFHPLRIAWHQAYDTLLQNARYEEEIAPTKIREIMKTVDGSHFPAFLPGLKNGESFVFGDTLGFYTVAMVPDKDREPKASIAILARVLSNKNKDIAPSIGKTTSDVLANEISRYIDLHPHYNLVHLHALRPGDGMTIGRALGYVVEENNKQIQKSEEMETIGRQHIGFKLELYPTPEKTGIVGKYLSLVAEERRTGAGYILEQDRWILDTIPREGDRTIPRLRWAKRAEQEPEISAHLSVAFDTFDSQVITDTFQDKINSPIEVYGLVVGLIREFAFTPQPVWRTFLSPVFDGEKHPAGRGYTERLIKLHEAIMKVTTRNLASDSNVWPILITELPSSKEESIRILHSLSDWVITIDRNAGMEYFDSPKEKATIYDAYIIDCVPEREDLGFLQMVTSTSNFDEIVNLLDTTLAEMGLSSSPRNCLFLLNELKGLSGRFAMRLAGSSNQSQEMIALALTHTHCRKTSENDSFWLSLSEGFFIPLDDVSLLGNAGKKDIEPSENSDKGKADLLYVYVPPRGGLQFAFVEVKFRRYLRTARSIDLIDTICKQVRNTRRKFEDLYISGANSLERTVRRSSLARILKFYANRGRRHNLSENSYLRIMKEIDKVVREGEKYTFSSEQNALDRGYIFCPEFKASNPAVISFDDQPQVVLFGATQMPDPPIRFVLPSQPEEQRQELQKEIKLDNQKASFEPIIPDVEKGEPASHKGIMIDLGNEKTTDESVKWNISISSNPHLMIVGLPGMGKTTCLINICLQMVKFGIVPIVFSYHDDIDTKMINKLGSDVHFVDYAGLGFNPLEVVGDSTIAYIDNVGMLRDNFSSIFHDLGEIQLGRLREALKQTYVDQGWADSGRSRTDLQLPSFQAFYDILKVQPKPEKNLLTRLAELDDYDFFRNTSGAKSLLDSNKPTVIRIHRTQNEVLQRAFATFVLHNLYQRMFQRGVQKQITHAIIFDEAHRAAKLKLIPSMVKECRKYGITFVVASQEARDFDPSVFNAIANYLVLRLTENDAKVLAKIMAASDQINRYTDKIKQLPKYHALFFGEGRNRATYLELSKNK